MLNGHQCKCFSVKTLTMYCSWEWRLADQRDKIFEERFELLSYEKFSEWFTNILSGGLKNFKKKLCNGNFRKRNLIDLYATYIQ